MTFIAENQLPLLLLFFLIGLIGTGFLFRKPAGHRAWKLADLVWVVLGGLGALVAVLAGLYTSDSSRLDRQIDVAYAATLAFDRDAARFRLRFCDPAYDPDTAVLCEKVEFLSASTASNADLPLFIAVTNEVAPLQGLHFLFGRASQDDMEEARGMAAKADAFSIEQFLVFTSLDETTQVAIDNMRRKVPAIAGDYLILAQSYDDLIEQVGKLKDEWEYLQANAHILVLQIIALCLVSFAAPFRLGKSIVELRTAFNADTPAPTDVDQPQENTASGSTDSAHPVETSPDGYSVPHS
ncbi:hypothetical protein SAMN05444358_1011235 [Ruegeria halocynthiae]|uniref:Uncharacterized protein n=1 Tax=Ruegeria halocynthiae TaxID=985054 RepID=A0A1H2UST1_9RHOB|nr:hypothetical protein SAMN05444358_1011235 [Ruegeria halocynthiae]